MEALMRGKFTLLVRLLCILSAISLAAEAQTVQTLAQAPSQQYGCAVKRPILGAACPFCPWGALADEVREAMKPLGYDVQICRNCSGSDDVRIVAERRKPLPLTPQQAAFMPPPPNGEVDFGVVDVDFLVDAYRGEGIYKKDGPRTNLRLIANIEEPEYYLVATRREAFITDLHQIKERKMPVRILAQDSIRSRMILSYYGITREELASWGGELTMTAVLSTTDIQDRDNFDVVMSFMNSLNNTPESNIWYELSQRSSLRYLQLPDDLLESMAKASEWEIGPTPVRLLRGMDTPIKTIRTSGTAIFGRADLPEQFAYDVAKAMDEQKHLLLYSILPFAYDSARVWQARGVPLHPGAERYYREKGYMPKAIN
jgi:hypothetical protein